MKVSGERYFPRIESLVLAPFEPYISYEHWHRYFYAVPFVAGKAVLDLASGEGYGSAFLAAHANLVYGVDVSEEAIRHARQTYVRDNLHFVQGSADAIPIPGEHCFDAIVSFETIEHLDAPTQERFAAEVKRLLRPDGVLLISTPNRSTYSVAGEQKNPYHHHEFTQDEFVQFLHRYFAHVRLLNQHVYPVSYLWNQDGSTGPLAEYQMRFDNGAFRPGEGDGKETGYLIAVCADRGEQAAGSDSLLIDLSEVAFRGIPGLERWQTTALYLDTGAGFRAEEVARGETEYRPEFTLKFTLDPSAPVRQLRWDPLESRLCQVRLRQVLWEDGEGLISRLDLNRVTSNGRQQDEATFQFETLDPMIFLPISGAVASVTIDGECVAASEASSLAGLEQSRQSREHQLSRQEHVLQGVRQQLSQQEHDLQGVRQQLASQEQSIAAYRLQLAQRDNDLVQRDNDLQGVRQQLASQEQSIAAYRLQLAQRDDDLQVAWQQLASQEQSIAAYRLQLAQRDDSLQIARGQIATQELSIEVYRHQMQVLTEQLQDRERQIERCEQRLRDLESIQAQLKDSLQSILQTKRWVAINLVRSALYFLPNLLSSWIGLLRGRLQRDQQSAAIRLRRRSVPNRTPGRHPRPGQAAVEVGDGSDGPGGQS